MLQSPFLVESLPTPRRRSPFVFFRSQAVVIGPRCCRALWDGKVAVGWSRLPTGLACCNREKKNIRFSARRLGPFRNPGKPTLALVLFHPSVPESLWFWKEKGGGARAGGALLAHWQDWRDWLDRGDWVALTAKFGVFRDHCDPTLPWEKGALTLTVICTEEDWQDWLLICGTSSTLPKPLGVGAIERYLGRH